MRHLCLVLFATLALEVSAQPSHLVPESGRLAGEGVLSDYETVMAETLIPTGAQQEVVARMVMRPSFGREWLVEIRRHSQRYTAYSIRPDSSIWYSGYSGGGGWSAEAARRSVFHRDSLDLPENTAELIGEAWGEALLDVRYPRRVVHILDGVMVNFSRWDIGGRGLLSGQTHSPPEGTVADAMIELGVLVGRYAEGEDVTLGALRQAAQQVSSLLTASE